MGSEVDQSKEWAKRHLQLRSKGSRHAAACVTASAELPLSPREAYELMSHPDNAVIFRGIERCTYRQVLWAAADAGRPSDGRQTVEVENESDWHFLFFRGSIQTRMLVHEDPGAGTIHVRLAPAGGTAPLQLMTGKWRFAAGSTPGSSQVSLEQEVHPRGLPLFFHNGFRAVAALQVRKTFEDLYAEALRMNAGNPSLAPYSQVVRKQILTTAHSGAAAAVAGAGSPAGKDAAAAAAGEQDPSSVLAAAYEAESSSSSITSSSRPWASGGQQRSPRPGLGQRGSGGLRSHPIGSLLDLACLADAPDASPVPSACSGSSAAGGGSASERTWRFRLYCLLQRLWLASNAALGDAQLELEEMAVLV